MKKYDWILLLLWAAELTVVGPFLFSARDWLLVLVGFASVVVLTYTTVARVRKVISLRDAK